MRRDRFFVPANYAGESLDWQDSKLSHQLKNVLRLSYEKKIYLFNNKNQEATVKILEIKKDNIKFKILSVQNLEESINTTTLYISLLKKDKFELVVQKATEVGVMKIVPLVTTRTVKQGSKIERWKEIAKEASEQSGRLVIPKISEPVLFKEAVLIAKKDNDLNIIFDVGGDKLQKIPDKVGIFVGPEGGFEDTEKDLANEAGFSRVGLGNFVLRAETAAIVGTFLIAGGWSMNFY
ncbi:MAG: RsmE family RNA methyltransferase [Candidatus Paceibacterota bacterium]|jgi:16S rRNA (uracil1498-N3)-methyltransferase